MAEEAPVRSLQTRILEVLEVLAKLVGASAVLLVALFANSLQSRLTGVSIQSQREQAESQLRAGMFSSLISPISGPLKEGAAMPADREALLTELLALNFNENFEMKPLMEHADKMLAEEFKAKSKGSTENLPDPREQLRSISRRIAERQKAAISREWATYKAAQNVRMWPFNYILGPSKASADTKFPGCEVYSITLDQEQAQNSEPMNADENCQVTAAFRDISYVHSVDGNYTLRIVGSKPNWEDQTLTVSAQPFQSSQTKPKATDPSYNFSLSWLDLPLTDNTLLPDGNRFAIYLRSVYGKTVILNVMWFPKGYFTPRERPLNYNEVQQLLGRDTQ